MPQDTQPITSRTFAIGRFTFTFAVNPRVVSDTPPTADEHESQETTVEAPIEASPATTIPPVFDVPLTVVESDMPAQPRPQIFGLDKENVGRGVGRAAIACMAVSGVEFYWTPGQLFSIPVMALAFAAAGGVLLLVALNLIRPKFEAFDVALRGIRATAPRIQWRLAFVAILALFLVGEAGRNLLLPTFRLPVDVQMALFVGGVLVLCRAFGAFRWSLKGILNFKLKTFQLKNVNRMAVALLAITFLGFGLRLWHMNDTVRIMIDEDSDYHAINVLNTQPTTPIFQPMMYGPANYNYLYPYLSRLAATLPTGFDLTGARLASVLLGGLTVPAVFLLGNALFDDVIGLIGAALMAVFPVALHFSRQATPNIADPLFGTLAIAFLARGFRRNSQPDFVLAGACTALSTDFYEGGRFVFFGVILLFLLLVFITRRPWWQRRGVILMILTGLAVAMPYYYTLTKFEFAPRVDSEVIRPKYIIQDLQTKPTLDVFTGYWNDALRKTIFHTIYSPDGSVFYYGGATGILLWYMVPFYLFGLFMVLWRFRYTRWVLWSWVIASILGISFIVSTDWTIRFLLMFPVMTLAVAIGLRYAVELIWPPVLRDRRVKLAAMAVIVAGLAVAEVNYYFNIHLPLYDTQIRQIPDYYDAFERAQAYSPSTIVYISDKTVFIQVLDTMLLFDHLNMTYKVWKTTDVTPDKLQALPRDRPLVFALSPDDQTTLSLIQNYLNVQGPSWSPYPTVPKTSQFVLYVYTPAQS